MSYFISILIQGPQTPFFKAFGSFAIFPFVGGYPINRMQALCFLLLLQWGGEEDIPGRPQQVEMQCSSISSSSFQQVVL